MSATPPAEPSWRFNSPWVRLPRENVDTDQIIPARFLTTTSREGLGPHAFHDWRYLADGSPNPDFPLDQAGSRAARILVVGHNFGCGSSREHAVWALLGAGFRAIISSAFADIFRGNALGNGLLPIQVDAAILAGLLADPDLDQRLGVNLHDCILTLPGDAAVPFPVPPFARHCLLNGVDELQFLLGTSSDVDAYERRHPASIDTRAGAPG